MKSMSLICIGRSFAEILQFHVTAWLGLETTEKLDNKGEVIGLYV